MAAVADPVGQHLIASLAKPGANITGLSSQAEDIMPKMLALFASVLPKPTTVAVLADARSEVHPRMWLAVSMALVGLAVVSRVWNGLTFDGFGVVMALLAAVSFAAYFLIAEHNVGIDDPLRVILWAFVVAAVAMNLIQPIWESPSLGGSTSMLGRLDHLSAVPWVVVVWVVVLGTVVPFFLELLALQHLPATIVTVIAMLEPVIANVLGWAWFRETLTPVQVLGAIAVLGGIGPRPGPHGCVGRGDAR